MNYQERLDKYYMSQELAQLTAVWIDVNIGERVGDVLRYRCAYALLVTCSNLQESQA